MQDNNNKIFYYRANNSGMIFRKAVGGLAESYIIRTNEWKWTQAASDAFYEGDDSFPVTEEETKEIIAKTIIKWQEIDAYIEKLINYIPLFETLQKNYLNIESNFQKPDKELYVLHEKTITNFIKDFHLQDEEGNIKGLLIDRCYLESMEEYGWLDEKKLSNDISNMNFERIGTCLTYIVRGEKFSRGNIDYFIKNGILINLLKRLKEME